MPIPSNRQERPLVLITGASGLIGTHVASRLVPEYRVVALDVKPPPAELPEEVAYVACDLTSDEHTAEALKTVRETFGRDVASVVHLAAYYDFTGAPSPLYEELTVNGTRRLMRELKGHFRTRQIVFSSSILAMKPVASGAVLRETSPVRGEWDYPESKLRAEKVLRDEHCDVSLVVLRIAGAYDEHGHSPPIAQQIWRIREQKLESFFFPGDASHGQSFIHVDDIALCIRTVIDRREELEPFELFLVGEPECLSYAELQDRIGERLHGREWPTIRVPAPVAKAAAWIREKTPHGERFIKPWMIDLADAHYPVSIDRAKARLHWSPRHRLSDTLPVMLDSLERDPDGWYAENGLPRGASSGESTEQGSHHG